VTSFHLAALFGQNNYLIGRGWIWQLLTALFIHLNILHLLGNMLFLLIYGVRTEEILSKSRYVLVYFGSGLAGNLLSLGLGPSSISAGASGAIFGLFGASVVYLGKSLGQSIKAALIYSFYLFMLTLGANVNFLAHFGGLAFGLVIGYWFARIDRRKAGALMMDEDA